MKRILLTIGILLTLLGQGMAQQPSFAFSQPSRCAPSIVEFRNTSPQSGSITSFLWSWGDGTPDVSGTDPSLPLQHPFTNPGTYTVTLSVWYGAGTTPRVTTQTITVVPVPQFTVTADMYTVCPNIGVQFGHQLIYPNDAGAIRAYFWDFGDGGESTLANPTYAFRNSDNTDLIPYSVSLRIVDTFGCETRVAADNPIRVYRKPDVNFTVSMGTGTNRFCYTPSGPSPTADFTNLTDANENPPLTNANTYEWNFGDGGTSTAINPSYPSFGPGRWDVTLTATSPSPRNCKHSETKETIEVIDFEPKYDPALGLTDTVVLCAEFPTPINFTIAGAPGLNADLHIRFSDGRNECLIAGNSCNRTFEIEGVYEVWIAGTYPANDPNGCKAYDTITVFVYDKIPAQSIITDTNMCKPTDSIDFVDATDFNNSSINHDFGKYNCEWIFAPGVSATGSNAQYNYGAYGEYVVSQIVTTPYGCVLDTVLQPIHVFPLHTRVTVVEPDPQQGPPEGCVPLRVTLANIDDSLKTSSPITDFIWFWDYENDTTNFTNTDSVDIATHIYPDTGVFETYVRLINRQGCTFDVPLATVKVGVEVLSGFNFDFMQDCNSMLSVPVKAYDSLQADTLVRINPYGSAKANDWLWIDPKTGFPVAQGDTTSVSFSSKGYQSIILQPLHNGCKGPQLKKDSVGYVCPPVAVIEYPTPDPEGNPPVFCGFPNFVEGGSNNSNPPTDGEITTKSAGEGAMKYMWYMGNADSVSTNYFSSQDSVGPFYTLYTWDTGEDSLVESTSASFDYAPDSAEREDLENFYLYKNGGVVVITLKVWNWDSTSNEYLDQWYDTIPNYDGSGDTVVARGTKPHPTYNRCKICEHQANQVILISDAVMRFISDTSGICQGKSVTVYDSSQGSIPFVLWDFFFINAAEATKSDFDLVPFAIDHNSINTGMLKDIEPKPKVGEGVTLDFSTPNIYEVALLNEDAFGCMRTDTIELTIWPQSIPAFTSSKTPLISGSFNSRKDTLCVNNPDTLYIKDISYPPDPFDTNMLKVIEWKWTVRDMKSHPSTLDTAFEQNPTFVAASYTGLSGWSAIDLTIKNDKGCDSTHRFSDQVLMNYILPTFTLPASPSANPKEYCNKAPIPFQNRSIVSPTTIHNQVTQLACEWDFGDGTRIIPDTILSGQTPYISHTYDIGTSFRETFIVTLRVKAFEIGCEETYSDTITIVRPVADFTDNGHNFPCPGIGITIAFQDSSQGSIEQYRWNFGDTASGSANVSYELNPVHTYYSAGSYDVMLVVRDSTQCIDTIHRKDYVRIDGPAGTVAYSPTSGCIPLPVRFEPDIAVDINNPLDPSADTLTINLDGGNYLILNKNQIRPGSFRTYRYDFSGSFVPFFQLKKWVMTEDGKELCVVSWEGKDTIWAIDLKPNFASDSLYCQDAEIILENTTVVQPSLLVADSTYWNYGNGDSLWIYNTTDPRNGKPTYDSAGAYRVTLTEFYKLCTRSITREVNVMHWPNLYFFPDTAIACDGLEVSFTADTLSPLEASRIVNYEWRFDDGDTIEGNPALREFNESGTYRYEVEITFTPQNCVKKWEDSVIIYAYKSPVAKFTPNPEEVETGGTIQFTDESELGDGLIDTWEWDFGYPENEGSEEQNPSHIFDVSGVWTVTLKIIDEYGCNSSTDRKVTVMEKLNFPNIFTPTGNNGQKYTFRPIEDKGTFKQFQLDIYDRWGMLVWSQECEYSSGCPSCCPNYNDETFWWDGRNKQGNLVSDGVYFWVVRAERMTGTEPIIQNGSITVTNAK